MRVGQLIFPVALLAGLVLLLGAMEPVTQPKLLSRTEAAKEGRLLVDRILASQPRIDLTNFGVIRIRVEGKRLEMPIRFRVIASPTNRLTIYQAANKDRGYTSSLCVEHNYSAPSKYYYSTAQLSTMTGDIFLPHYDDGRIPLKELDAETAKTPFAGSDFWVMDLGMEFFHWPEQYLLKKEMRRGQSCDVLESVNPHPAPGLYARVVSWLDIDTAGIVHADAYDAQNKLLKEFDPREFKKTRESVELKEMEISNRQTGSRTTIEFDFGQK